MDVCLVLTHRCNLACTYCYAGDHHARRMEDEVIDRAVDLLFADGAERAQLSFFGGEPFLRLEAMRRAVTRARARAAGRGAPLTLQCTTNGTVIDPERVAFVRETGMRVTVSIDGVREAHELHRPTAGGGSSFDTALRGLRMLIAAGARPDALMVVSPQTVTHVYRSVSWLWDEGVTTVRANAVLDAPWEPRDRDELREQLWAVAAEMVARRRAGQAALFEPFARALRGAGPGAATAPARRQIVVATGGNLYPCAPMVGEDRDAGPEAALRLGHLDDGAPAIASRIDRRGAGCDRGGKACACAAYLETGDRDTAGPNGLWYGRLVEELGTAAAAALAPPRESGGTARRPFLVGLAAAVGAAAVAAPALLRAGLGAGRPATTPVELEMVERVQGGLEVSPPEPVPEPPPDPPAPGQMLAPPEPDIAVDGNMRSPEVEMVRGEIGPPPAPAD